MEIRKILKPGTSQHCLARRKNSLSFWWIPYGKIDLELFPPCPLQTIKMQKPHAARAKTNIPNINKFNIFHPKSKGRILTLKLKARKSQRPMFEKGCERIDKEQKNPASPGDEGDTFLSIHTHIHACITHLHTHLPLLPSEVRAIVYNFMNHNNH